MKVFIGRQPIFTAQGHVAAYELLYRNSEDNKFPGISGSEATMNLIVDSFLNMGIKELSDGKPCFINFTEELLELGIFHYLDPESAVIEILEDIPLSSKLAGICRALKAKRFKIALDDFFIRKEAISPEAQEILSLVDYIKVDLTKTESADLAAMMSYTKKYNVTYIAEKVETHEQFQLTERLGCVLFQGYFFSQPVILSGQDMPLNVLSYFKIIKELNEDEPDIDEVAHYIEQDLSLSYKLLKLMNSPALRPARPIHSIKQAIVLLGLKEIKRWIYIMSVRSFSNGNDPITHEVIRLSLIRGRICEQLALKTNRDYTSSYLMTGMFSLIDTLLRRDMQAVLNGLPLADCIKDALSGADNDQARVYGWARRIELADFQLPETGLTAEEIYSCYVSALNWAEQLMNME
ncbi:HDOD domain-containing protein [Bacillus mangrovi]|uniref:HDOD domain-containing protein n=1 Tax=Metabacillus mangrovi TaxID=1491830 RepID=A0A7X2SAN7_9BACI|nr:HDOD domain-containing protein [Metabacillus mangrovi]MTH55506.1 HDOD domain-containing protein [Metabacillus mangrovi]